MSIKSREVDGHCIAVDRETEAERYSGLPKVIHIHTKDTSVPSDSPQLP